MADINALIEQMENLILAWSETSGGSHLDIALAVLVLLERFPMVGSIVEQRIENLLLRNRQALINGGEIYAWGDPKHGTGSF